jgi:hypothetical protein
MKKMLIIQNMILNYRKPVYKELPTTDKADGLIKT